MIAALATADYVALDPPIPADGSCANCGGERKMPASKLHREHATADPFCSSNCCRAWYGLANTDHSHGRPRVEL